MIGAAFPSRDDVWSPVIFNEKFPSCNGTWDAAHHTTAAIDRPAEGSLHLGRLRGSFVNVQ